MHSARRINLDFDFSTLIFDKDCFFITKDSQEIIKTSSFVKSFMTKGYTKQAISLDKTG